MVKTPHTRHSKSTKEPVTIDLAPGEVSRVKAEAEKQAQAAASASEDKTAPKEQPAAAARMAEPSAKSEKPAQAAPQKEAEKPKAASSSPSGANQSFGRKDPETPPLPTQTTSRRGGGMLSGAIAGGVVALLVAGGLSYSGLLPTRAGAPVQEDTSGSAIAALENELASLREQVAALGTQGGGEDVELAGRIGEVEAQVTAFASELETLRDQMAQPAASAEPADTGPLDERIAALETALGELRDGTVQEPALEERIVALREEIVTLREAGTQAAGRLDALERDLGDLGSRVDEVAETPATAVIIAASSLKAAIDRGTSFTTELETYASLRPDAPEIGELRELAASGVPTRAQIAAEADAAANAMIAVARPVDPDAGVFDRLRASAMGLVQVRPVGMVEGEGVPETAARMDAAIQAGDLERALAEFETMPAAAKAAGESFATKVRARHAADRLVDQALAAALRN